ncbi:MAG: F0F1 ATP synthase subunit A [Candidatus Gastranaerophilales bacterium]|nr:F0F1 ATP synthase subunit A [Candidatus Gastranaerophilales bacterium]
MEISIGEHWIGHICGMQVHMDTLVTMWITMGLLIIASFIMTRRLSVIPGKAQTVAEAIMGYFIGLTGNMGKDGKKHAPLLATLFLFILSANLIGQLPWRLYHIKSGGEFASPTNDLNMTAAMAIIVLIYYIGAGILKKGPKYFLHYFSPLPILAPMNMLEDVIRPFSLALRLFGNILAGEVMILVFVSFFAYFLPLPFMLFEVFVAFIQALVFTLLTSAYLTLSLKEH